MKFFIPLLLLASIYAQATPNEIAYYNKSWKEIQAKAKAENKYILVDCYTDWCVWCKVMDKETLPDPEVAAFINKKFIPVKMDMEHGEGVKLAMKYHISGYPTFAFFNPSGQFVYVSVGYEKKNDFMDELKKGIDKSKQFAAPGFSTSIDMDFPQLYKNAFAENGKKKFPRKTEVDSFLNGQTDLFSEINYAVLARFDVGEKYTKFFLDNFKKYNSLYGSYTTDNKLQRILIHKTQSAIKDKSDAEFNETLEMVDKYEKNDPENMKSNLRMDYYNEMKQWTKLMSAFDAFIKLHGYDNPDYINSVCWGLYEKCDDKNVLNSACTHMQIAVQKKPEYAFMDTYAALLYKTGQYAEAKTWANKAIAAGKEKGDDVTSTEALLEKINATGK